MPDLIRVLSADRWLYVDPETGEIVGEAPDVPTVPDDGLIDRIQRTIIPTPFRSFRGWGNVTREQFESWPTNVCQALWRSYLKKPIPGASNG